MRRRAGNDERRIHRVSRPAGAVVGDGTFQYAAKAQVERFGGAGIGCGSVCVQSYTF